MNKIYLFEIENLSYFHLKTAIKAMEYNLLHNHTRFFAFERKVNIFFLIITIRIHKTLPIISATFVQHLRNFTGRAIAIATIFD